MPLNRLTGEVMASAVADGHGRASWSSLSTQSRERKPVSVASRWMSDASSVKEWSIERLTNVTTGASEASALGGCTSSLRSESLPEPASSLSAS